MVESLKVIGYEKLAGLLGLIIASTALGWNILNEIRKVPKAKVYAIVGKLIQPGIVEQDERDYLVVTIVNVGSRPLRINGIACVFYKWWWPPFKKKQAIIIPRQLPVYLKDGEQHIEHFVYTPAQFKKLLDDKMQILYAYDSAGRAHKLSRWGMIKFKRGIRRHLRKFKEKAS